MRCFFVFALSLYSVAMLAQGPTLAPSQTSPPSAPATKLEAFKPAAGSVSTLGYTNFGNFSGITVSARQVGDARGHGVRGLVVTVRESEYRDARSFVDADEIGELLKAVDALLDGKANPTPFNDFEVSYTTKGELELTAFSSDSDIRYAIAVGRTLRAQRFISASEMRRLRDLFYAAQQKLAATKTNP